MSANVQSNWMNNQPVIKVDQNLNKIGAPANVAPEIAKQPQRNNRFKSDHVELAKLLNREVQSVTASYNQNDNDIYGWTFKSGEMSAQNKATEMNIVFLGTGSMPHFGENQVISKSGDVLCHLAMQKAMSAKQPSMIVKGVGTVVLNRYGTSEMDKNYPLESLCNPNIEYAGKMSEIMLGHGLKKRIKISMEEFFIPNLIKMIKYNEVNESGQLEVAVNVVGHSRGAITGFHMISGIENWLKLVKNESHLLDIKKISAINHLEENDVIDAIDRIKSDRVKCKIHSLAFDPVEGKCRTSEVKKWFSNDTNIPVCIEGVAKAIDTNCSKMPKSVASARVHLAQSERRLDFRPTVPEFSKKTKVEYKVQQGTHSTMTGNIGDADGTGQDAFETIKKYPFVREAALAVIDQVKLEAAKFVFKDNLPPLQRQVMRRIIRKNKAEQVFAYQNTLAYFNTKLIENLSSNIFFYRYAFRLAMKLLPQGNFNIEKLLKTHADLRIRCCEWLMRKEGKLTSKAYSLLEKDIHDMYLHSNDPIKKEQLSEWEDEMKRDSSTIIAGPLTGTKYLQLRLQNANQGREIYLRKGSACLSKQALEDFIVEQQANTELNELLYTTTNSYFPLFEKLQEEPIFEKSSMKKTLLFAKDLAESSNHATNERDSTIESQNVVGMLRIR